MPNKESVLQNMIDHLLKIASVSDGTWWVEDDTQIVSNLINESLSNAIKELSILSSLLDALGRKHEENKQPEPDGVARGIATIKKLNGAKER